MPIMRPIIRRILRPTERLGERARGRVVAEQRPAMSTLHLDGRPGQVDFLHRR